jgi:hypothetical protein
MRRVVPQGSLRTHECEQGAEENLMIFGASELSLPGTSSPPVVGGEEDGLCSSARPDARGAAKPVLPGAERRRTAGRRTLGRSRSSRQYLPCERSQGFSECCGSLLSQVVAFFCPMQGPCQLPAVPVCLRATCKYMILTRKGRMSRAISRTKNSGIKAWTFVHNVNILRCSVEGDARFALNSNQPFGRRSFAPFGSAKSADPLPLFVSRCDRFIRRRAYRVALAVPEFNF